MRARRILALQLVLPLLFAPTRLPACTLWGDVQIGEDGGTIISKNRDWRPDHTQVLKKVVGKRYAYFGLYAEGNDDPGLKEGVNEKGLCAVSATASSIPQATREGQPGKGGLLSTLLASYASCDEVLAHRDSLFAGRRPSFVMISDRYKILTVEIGLNGRYAVKVTAAGSAAHTNHYVEQSLTDCNVKVGTSSAARFKRIGQLLQDTPNLHTTSAFAAISNDRNNGVDNSLWRTGRTTRTLSSWILESPAQGPQRLRVVLANPGKSEDVREFVLDESFWRKK